MSKVITLGEIMLRLSPPGKQRFSQAGTFDVTYGGGEANVAVSLANYGHQAVFVSALPDNEIGNAAIALLKSRSVDTTCIRRSEDRMGIYFLEHGTSMRPSRVIYDRTDSAIARAKPGDFDWEEIFAGADWFHWSGITPAISATTANLTTEACKAATALGIKISVDLNFRKKLWSRQRAISVMTPLMEYVQICIGNEEDAYNCLGFAPGKSNVQSGALDMDSYGKMFEKLQRELGFEYVASSLRESISASDNGWSGMLYDGKKLYTSRHYDIRIEDRVGAGDSFAAGIIHGLLSGNGGNGEYVVNFAAAASALKHTIPGDVNLSSLSEIEELLKGDGSGRIKR